MGLSECVLLWISWKTKYSNIGSLFFWPETGMYIPYTVYHKSPIHLLQGTKEIRNVLQGIGCLTICWGQSWESSSLSTFCWWFSKQMFLGRLERCRCGHGSTPEGRSVCYGFCFRILRFVCGFFMVGFGLLYRVGVSFMSSGWLRLSLWFLKSLFWGRKVCFWPGQFSMHSGLV